MTGVDGIPVGLDRHKVAAARLAAATRYPYLASALFASPVVAAPGIATVAIDEHWRVYADPAVVDAWSVPDLAAELVHHVGHLLRDHAARGRELGFGPDDCGHWLDAADAEINDDLPADLQLPGEHVLPGDLGCEEGRFAEEYFRLGEHRPDRRRPDCGSGAHGQPRAWDEGGPDGGADGLDDPSAALVRRQVAAEVLAHARRAGTVPAGLARWAKALLEPKVDWRAALAAAIRRGVCDVAGAVDYSYRRPSRRATVLGDVVLPSLRRPVPAVAVVVDTSGSMDDHLLGAALAEVDAILRGVGVAAGGVHVVSCDTKAHLCGRVRTAYALGLTGGGGTDMGAGIAAALGLRPRPDVVVVLTDGFTPWPPTAPARARVVVGLLGDGAPAPPAWATTIHVDEAA